MYRHEVRKSRGLALGSGGFLGKDYRRETLTRTPKFLYDIANIGLEEVK
jgi:hypothetical protein